VNTTRYETAVLGGGAVGLVAALCSARRKPTVLLLRSRTETGEIPRIETLPAPMLSLLIDYGVHPRRIGVDRLYEMQHVAWECADPEIRRGRAMAHVDKAKLTSELLSLAARIPHLDIVIDPRALTHGKTGWIGPGWSARRLIDATGRAAATAARRDTAPKPWVARPFWRAAPAPATLREFKIAALPQGYVYRVGSNEVDSLWVAGRGASLSASPQAIETAIGLAGADWLLEGLPPLESLQSGRAFPVSVQWAERSAAIAVGDAALARDVLSSQGMATGLSSACYAAAAESENDCALVLQHQLAERARHLQSLSQLVAACRYGKSVEWQQYADFIGNHLEDAPHDTIRLSEGRLRSVRHVVFGASPKSA
jgi:2-polyprenyl-6-methoxyphenol hydroxylase-like FAD-dependent oxidoreductase